MNAIIWKESIYKNDFKCSHCGVQLTDGKGQPTDNVGFDADLNNRQDILYCCNCKTAVAVIKDIKDYSGELPKGTTLGGKWKGELR